MKPLADRMLAIVRREQDGEGGPPSVRYLARRLGVRQEVIVELAEDMDLCVNVATGIRGLGYFEHGRGDYTIEDLNAPDPAEASKGDAKRI